MAEQDLSKVDTNFQPAAVEGEAFAWTDARQAPIEVTGVWYEESDDAYVRFDLPTREATGEDVAYLGQHNAGGQLRFRTNSPEIALRVELRRAEFLPHMPLTGVSGMDVYAGTGAASRFIGSVKPAGAQDIRYEGVLALRGGGPSPEIASVVYPLPDREGLTDITVNFPLYNGVRRVEVGVKPGSLLGVPTPHTVPLPLGVSGSSITQGACASRPGLCYAAHLARWIDAPMINTGCSGNGMGQPAMADFLGSRPMSVLVMDYDYNALSVDWLRDTHEPFFRRIREKQPLLPVIFVSNPNPEREGVNRFARTGVIFETYQNARARGDRHVYFVDGAELYGDSDRDSCTVDFLHPNDLGFYRMAERLRPVVEQALREAE